MDTVSKPEGVMEENMDLTAEERERQYLSDFEQEKLEDFREKIQLMVDESLKKGDPVLKKEHSVLNHINQLDVNELGEKEHRLYKLYRKFTHDYKDFYQPGWPGIKDHPFMRAVREYDEQEVQQLLRTEDVPEPVRTSKVEFEAYLKNEALALDAQYRHDQYEKEPSNDL